jgi:hypothetical protein
MNTERLHTDSLTTLFKRNKIVTMADMKEALGTSADATVFRKIRTLASHTSYSHRGRFYTLDEIAQFDKFGLWSFRSVWFSVNGTLVATTEVCVNTSQAGYYADELESLLHVTVHDVLGKLTREGRVAREKVDGRYLYCSSKPDARRGQLTARSVQRAVPSSVFTGFQVLPDELKAAIILFYSLLDEKQRRLYAGLESMKFGHGGDTRIAELLALDVATVAKGRKQLLDHDVERDRVRGSGAGRPSVEKKRRKSSQESKN